MQLRLRRFTITVLLLFLLLSVTGCTRTTPQPAAGKLTFTANGEEFIREGFVSKDGWELAFTNVYVSLADMTAYVTNPAYDTAQGWDIKAAEKVTLSGTITVDLAGEDADPAVLGTVENVPAGHYNAASWTLARAENGPAAGYVLVLRGTASRGGEEIQFTLRFDEETFYQGGEYIGDERKGIVSAGGSADVEATFHFDHLFGDGEKDPGDELNTGALGFDPFAAFARNGAVELTSADLKERDPVAYQQLVKIWLHLGHVGEGHCLARFR